MVVSATGWYVFASPQSSGSSSNPPKWTSLLWVTSPLTILVVWPILPFRLSGSMTCRLNTNIATTMDHNSTCIVLLSLSATLHMHMYVCTVYTALSAVNTKFTSTILFSTLNYNGEWISLGLHWWSLLHSSLIFNCSTVEFLTCTQHSENHADPLVQSLTISNSKTKLEAAMWSNTRRTFYGYSTFSHAMANTQTPMLWSGKIISQRTKLTQTSLISCPIHMWPHWK